MSGCSDLQLAQGGLRRQRASCAIGSTGSVSWPSRSLFFDQELGIGRIASDSFVRKNGRRVCLKSENRVDDPVNTQSTSLFWLSSFPTAAPKNLRFPPSKLNLQENLAFRTRTLRFPRRTTSTGALPWAS